MSGVSVLDAQLLVVANLVNENLGLRQELDRVKKENQQLAARLVQEGEVAKG